MRPITEEKFESISKFLDENKLDVLMITDYENSRNINLQYLSGHPTDATLLIHSSGIFFLRKACKLPSLKIDFLLLF